MKPLALALLVLALFAAPAHAASFDCAQAGTEVEHMICGNAELSKLDELLGDRYVRARGKAADPDALRGEQRAWLRDVRNACANAACLKAAYETRIAELTRIGWMTEEKARAICERVAGAKVDGSYNAAFRKTGLDEEIVIDPEPGLQGYRTGPPLNIDYDSDGKVEKLVEMGQYGGTCQLYTVSKIVDVTEGEPEQNPAFDLEWRWGHEVFLIVDGEPVFARTPNAPRSVLQLAWLAPSGTRLPLCSISVKHERRLNTVTSKDPALCQAVSARSVTFVPWEEALDQAPKILRDIPIGRFVNDMARLSVDLDMDGDTDVISWVNMATTAGCGWGYHNLVEMTPDFAALEDSPLNTILTGRAITDFPHGAREWDPRPDSPLGEDGKPRIFIFDGKPYILGRAGKYARESAAVLSLWGGAERTWCEYEYPAQPVSADIRFYPVQPPAGE